MARARTSLPVPLSPVIRIVDRLGVAAVDPRLVRQIRRTELDISLGIVAMAGDAIGGEDGLAGLDPRGGLILPDSGIGKASDVGHDVVELTLLEQPVPPERHHLRTPALRVGRVDADANRLGNGFGIAAPEP